MTTLYSRSESSQEFRRMGRVELIEELNALEVLGGLFMGSFELIEGSRRGHGGQGIVQVCRNLQLRCVIRNLQMLCVIRNLQILCVIHKVFKNEMGSLA
jgi:hypothetical protein